MPRPCKTVVTRVPVEMKNAAKMWQRLVGGKTEYDGWKQVMKIYNSKNSKIYDERIFRL